MSGLRLRPYQTGDSPARDTVAVSVIVLTSNESINIERCLDSLSWARQVVVLDSGSTDDTVTRAEAAGAEVVGFLDGRAGLQFCLYHAWFQLTIDALRTQRRPAGIGQQRPGHIVEPPAPLDRQRTVEQLVAERAQ